MDLGKLIMNAISIENITKTKHFKTKLYISWNTLYINLLAPWRCGNHFRSAIFECLLWIKSISTYEIALIWMPLDLTNDRQH